MKHILNLQSDYSKNGDDSEYEKNIAKLMDNMGDAFLETVYVFLSSISHLPNSTISQVMDLIQLAKSV